MNSITATSLSRTYGKEVAVHPATFSIEKGELFGLIGPDGAGKTTLFQMLTSLLVPTTGNAAVEGFDTVANRKEIRKIIGYMPGRFSLYQDLTIEENLNFFATIFGTSLTEGYELIEEIYVQIEPFKKRRAGALSGGMKQKLALCCALIHQPKVLFLDEPTTGVDAVSRAEFWAMLKRLKAKGITIMVSTPYMDEAALCERIALIHGGKILQIDRPDILSESYQKPLFAVGSSNNYHLLKLLRTAHFAHRVAPFGEFLHLTVHHNIDEAEIADFLKTQSQQPFELRPIAANIEDVFLELSANNERA